MAVTPAPARVTGAASFRRTWLVPAAAIVAGLVLGYATYALSAHGADAAQSRVAVPLG